MKILLKSLILLILLIASLLAAFILWLKTENANQVIAAYVNQYIQKQIGHKYKIKLQGLTISWPFVIEVQNISLQNEDKNIISAEKFCLNPRFNISDRSVSYILTTSLRAQRSNPRRDDGHYSQPAEIATSATPPRNDVVGFTPPRSDYRILARLEGQISLLSHSHNNLSFHNITDFELSSDYSSAEGKLEIAYPENTITLRASYVIESHLRGTIDVNGPLDNLHITTETSGHINFSEQNYWQLPNSNLHTNLIVNSLAGDINGNITFDSEALKASAEINKNGHNIYLKNFNAEGQNLASNANLSFDMDTQMLTGEFNFNSKNIANLKSFLPFVNKGTLELKTTYKQEGGLQKIAIAGNAKNLFTDFANIDFLDFDLALNDLWNMGLNHAYVKIKSLVLQGGSIKELILNAKGENGLVNFATQVKSLDPYQINLKINGKLIPKNSPNDNLQIFANAQGKIGNLNVSTTESSNTPHHDGIHINIGKKYSLLARNIKVNDGSLDLEGSLNGSKINGTIQATKFPALITPGFLPELFDHALVSGSISLDGTLDTPLIDSKLTIDNIALVKTDVPFLSVLKLSVCLYANQLTLATDIIRDKKSVGTFNANLPIQVSLSPFTVLRLEQDPLDIFLKLNQEANILGFIPLPPGHKLLGDLNGQLHVSGSFSSPVVDGSMTLSKTVYKYKVYGIVLKNISAKILAQNKSIKVTNLIVEDSVASKIHGEGTLSLLSDIPFNFNLKADNFSFINTPYVQGEATGKLTIAGNKHKALASGQFDLGPMEIKIPEHFKDEVPTINIVKGDHLGLKGNNNNLDDSYILNLDIILNAQKQVYVRGRGVDTLLSGELKITNNFNNPNILGKLKSVRGKYQEFGKFLLLREGVLDFYGPIDPSPYINIVGVTNTSGVEIRVKLAGSIFNPVMLLESTPAMTQDKALSLLLFGKNTDSISTIQALTLADSMRRLSGQGSDFNPLAIGRKLIGVDDISVKNNGDTNTTSIGAGKYLTDKVYLEVEHDEIKGTKTKIEVELTPKISVEGATTDQGTSSLGVNWRFDY